MRFRLTLVFVSLLFCLSSCARVFNSATPEAKATVLSVATRYLAAVVSGDEATVAYMLDWPTYLDDGSNRFTREEYVAQFRNVTKRWSAEQHPLQGLEVLDVSVRGDNASTSFRKVKGSLPPEFSRFPEINVDLKWNGNGWIVVNDNLFGKGQLFSSIPAKSRN